MCDFSFIIPHKGREELLINTISSINQQAGDFSYEIIVATQNKKVCDYVAHNSNVYFLDECFKISQLRNFGAEKSKGNCLVFLDSDIELDSNWLVNINCTLDKLGTNSLLATRQVPGIENQFIDNFRCGLKWVSETVEVDFVSSQNMIIRRTDFFKTAGFPEHLATCEDYVFCERFKSIGKVFLTSEANYVHLGEDKGVRQLFQKEMWRGQSNFVSVKGRKVSLKEWPSLLVPVLFILTPLLTVLSILNAYFLLFTIFPVLLVLVYALVAVRRLKIYPGSLPLNKILGFYVVYFSARGVGSIFGLFNQIRY
ncbi:glycosyltransferase [Salinibius halmophilus]|uniref:glycosyltransferase n=1 Tax=Salinibius halmophilus TaxID=1853216 RepID=UPI000E674668|nr:glycosyltransferase family A protein [Salinibius halmophilus]